MESLVKFIKDFDEWPNSWAGDENDILIGKSFLLEFKNYLLYLIKKERSAGTIRRHANYLWALGGEIIREINLKEINIRKLTGKEILLQFISEQGGLYWRHAYNPNDHNKYDSVCRQLNKFIKNEKLGTN